MERVAAKLLKTWINHGAAEWETATEQKAEVFVFPLATRLAQQAAPLKTGLQEQFLVVQMVAKI